MKQWGKNWLYWILFSTAILMLLAGLFYLFRELILAGSSQYVSYDVTEEGQTALSAITDMTAALSAVAARDGGRRAGRPGYVPEKGAKGAGVLSGTGDVDALLSDGEKAQEPPPSGNADEDEPHPRAVDPEQPMVALTFDDGPGKGTAAILDLLERYDAKATFFVIGLCLEQAPQAEKMQRAYEMGCVVGSHTYDHISFKKLDAEQIRAQIERADELLIQYTGAPAPLVRPPYGHITDTAREAASTPYIHWSIDTEDWLSRDPESVVAAVQENVQDGDIILMHDIYPTTAEACETLIPWLIEQGYQLVTVPEMMEAKGVHMENGQMYKNAR